MSIDRTPTVTGPKVHKMLRWFPASWRARYGDELAVMIEDDLEGRSPTLRYRLSIVRSGLNEHLRETGLLGDSVAPTDRVRGGALAVLCAFALFVIPGVTFAKISEHWDESIHRGSRHLPAISFNLLASLAVACGVAVMAAAVALLPLFIQFLRTGGWPVIRRRILWAATATMTTGAVIGGLAIWARHLTYHQRNAGFGWYQLLFVIAAILFATTVALWTAAAVSTARRLNIKVVQVKLVGVLGVSVSVCMPVMTVAAALWWESMSQTAPWFLTGAPEGSTWSPLALNLLIVLIVMTLASVAGMFGSVRVIRSWRLLRNN
jgi:hypothetical protein